MNFPSVRPAFALLLFAGLLPAADQQLMSLLMPDAKIVAGINVEQVKNSPFGQFLFAQMQNGNGGFGKLTATAGFDPSKDLSEVLMGTPAQAAVHKGLVLAKGTFNPELIFTVAQAAGHTVETYHGVQILTAKDGSVNYALAFLGSTIAIAGDLDSVHGAIDRRTAGGIPIDPALAAMVNQLSNALDAWSVSTAPLGTLAGQNFPDATRNGLLNSGVLQAIQQTSAGIKFGAIVELSAQMVTNSNQSANSLADVVRFLGSMVQANAPASNAAAITLLIKSLSVQADGNTVSLALSIPEEQLEGFFRAAEQGNAKHATHDQL